MRVFVTGATGWIGSAVVPELLAAGHDVVGLARSDDAAAGLTAAGAEPLRGSLDDPETLAAAAAESDGVVHLAFKHDLAFSGDFPAAIAADGRAIATLGAALAHSNRPLVIASGFAGYPAGQVIDEDDTPDLGSPGGARGRSEQAALALAGTGVRSCSVRLAPTVHGEGDTGFVATLVAIARDKGVAGYLGSGEQHWPAVHRLDAAQLLRLALEGAPAGSVLHAAAEEGVPLRAVAEVVGRRLGVPVASVAPEEADAHFGWLARFVGLDVRASGARTRALLSWVPSQPGLLEDLEQHYVT